MDDAFLANMFSDAKTTVAVLSAVFAFCTLVVQYWVGDKQAKVGSRQAEASRISADAAMLTAKSSGNRAVATMRVKWVEELRGVISEYHSILMSKEKFDASEEKLLAELGTKIDLMMNLNEPDQKALWDLCEETYRTKDLEKRKACDQDLMAAGRTVLKNEWEKIKRELRGDAGQPEPPKPMTWWRWLRSTG